jgi:Holliday junction resolvase RusA-like endonuclease
MPGYLPPINSASGVHWRTKQGWKREASRQVFAALIEAKWRPAEGPFEFAHVTCLRRSSHVPDRDNLAESFKHVVDCIVRAGVLVDDAPNHARVTYLWAKAPPNAGGIEVVITEGDDPSRCSECGRLLE